MTNGTHVDVPVGMILREIRMRSCPPCRVCLSKAEVIVFPCLDESGTICPDCCDKAVHPDGEEGHVWIFDRWEGWYCDRCGIPKKSTRYAYDDVDRG